MAKKKKGRPQGTGGLRACPEVQDELLALKAIYGHDLNVSPDGKTFTLVLSYAVDGPEQRTVGCKLQLRYGALGAGAETPCWLHLWEVVLLQLDRSQFVQ